MVHQKKHEYVQEGEFTERQWFQKGYLLNEGAEGAERYTNATHQQTSVYYTAEQVHEGGEELKQLKKQRAHEAYVRRKEEEQLRKENEEYREHMHTEHQWLFDYDRIPNKNADWELGEELNSRHGTCSYGSSYCYCHESDTRAPKDADELAVARWRSNYYYAHHRDPKARKVSTFTDEEILQIIAEYDESRQKDYFS